MNLVRSLSRHQLYYLKEVCSGRMRLEWSGHWNCWAISEGGYSLLVGHSKPRGRRLMVSGGHMHSSIIELEQRGLLVRDGEKLVPSKEAAKQFGAPPALPSPKRVIAMSRTRPARVQPLPSTDAEDEPGVLEESPLT